MIYNIKTNVLHLLKGITAHNDRLIIKGKEGSVDLDKKTFTIKYKVQVRIL